MATITRVTLKEIASRADVSHTTVSRVLNGNQSISRPTRDRVLTVAKELDYRPNRRSQTHATHKMADRPLRVQLVFCQLLWRVEDSPAGYFMQIVQGCNQAAQTDGNIEYHWSYWQPDEDPQKIVETVRAGGRSGGVILIGHSRPSLVRMLQDEGVAVVLADHEHAGLDVDAVLPDNVAGGVQAAQHLIDRGFRRIGWLGGPDEMVNWTQRLLGVQVAMARAGLTMREDDRRNSCGQDLRGLLTESIEKTMGDWLSEGDMPEALILPSTWQAAIVQRVMLERGRRCPDDLSMVSFDNDLYAAMCSTRPTRLATFPEQIGVRAVERLSQILRREEGGGPAYKTVIPMKLIEDQSVGQPPKR
ncbi:MAG: LacI family DNA-binding transcriptional regulator [Phycisphaeraceae bacterium]